MAVCGTFVCGYLNNIFIFAKKYYMNTEVLRIIEGGLANDHRKIISYASRLADRLAKEGDASLAKCIRQKIDTSVPHSSIVADAIRTIPLDSDSRLQIVEVVPSDVQRQNIVLTPLVEKQISEFVDLVINSSKLEIAGVHISKSLLLYGKPGCGKTSIANYICEKTGLPLVVARLDGIVSSLLGSTAKNIRKIFEYANSFPCILFLDEFDAIAKARDDIHELGELKRVVNSLLQNIDSMPQNSVLIAATNHPGLLDPAVWRRFVQKVEVDIPDEEEIIELISVFTESFGNDYLNDKQKVQSLVKAFQGLSPSEIKTIFDKAKVKCVISGSRQVSYYQLLFGIFELKNKDMTERSLIRFLSEHGMSQIAIHDNFDISLRKIKTVLSEKS